MAARWLAASTVAGALVVACSSGGAGSLDNDAGAATSSSGKTIAQMSHDDHVAVCDDVAGKFGGYGKDKKCPSDGGSSHSIGAPRTQSQCANALDGTSCSATSAELLACMDALIRDACTQQPGAVPPECKPFFDKCPGMNLG